MLTSAALNKIEIMYRNFLSLIVIFAMASMLTSFTSFDSPVYGELETVSGKVELNEAHFYRVTPTDELYSIISCAVPGLCDCGLRCVISIASECCAPSSCLCTTQADQDAIQLIQGWSTWSVQDWITIDHEDLVQEDMLPIIDNYLDLSCIE